MSITVPIIDYFYHVHVRSINAEKIYTYRITDRENDLLYIQLHEGKYSVITTGRIDQIKIDILLQVFTPEYIERDAVMMMIEYLTYDSPLPMHKDFGQEVFHSDVHDLL